ncbi:MULTISPECIES: hypothetical protein [unclassified Curtobacterium]|uniref:hypothetical protein n=1 Tax=unclassified Curtobacterium TaxID=257496 RepID=UPI00382C1B58
MTPIVRTSHRLPLVATAAAALLGSSLVAGAAEAAEPAADESTFISAAELDALAPNGSAALDPRVFLEGIEQLEASPAPRQTFTADGHTYHRYVVDDGAITLPSADDVRGAIAEAEKTEGTNGTITPFLEARFSGIKTAIGFNTVDQQALAAGGGAAIGAAICLIPGVGWAACAAIGVVVSVATTYVFKNGICSGGRKLWWYDVKGGSTVGCRSSAPF